MEKISQVLNDLKQRTKKESQAINETLDKELNTLRASLKEKFRQEGALLKKDIESMSEAYRSEVICYQEDARRKMKVKPWWMFFSTMAMCIMIIFLTFLWEKRALTRIDNLKTDIQMLEARRVSLAFPTVNYQEAEYIRIVPQSQVALEKPTRTWTGKEKARPIGTYARIYKSQKKEH